MESFTSAIQTLIKTNKDFPQKFKQRLVLESHNVTNHFKFMVGLITEGVLSDESSDTEASVGLKEMMVQLAMMIVCSQGADAIGSLAKTLEASGNLKLISSLWSWMKEDFAIETEGVLSEPKGTAAVPTGTSKKLASKQLQNSAELESIAAMLTDKIVSRMEYDFLEQLEGHWLGQASNIVNVPEFCSILAQQKVLHESDMQLKTGMESIQDQWAQKAIKEAVSKRAIASIVLAFQLSGNEFILQETQEWLETSQAGKKNYPIAVKSLPNQLKHQKPAVGISRFFEQAPPVNELKKVATFNCSPESFTKGKSALKFNKEKMTAAFSEGTLRMWNWRENEETTINFGDKMKGLTACHFDEEIIVLGTDAGTVHLFDARTMEEKWSVRLGEPVNSLQITDSTLAVTTGNAKKDHIWWVEISRSDMRLLNQRPVLTISKNTNYGILMDYYSFVYYSNVVLLHCTKSGESILDNWSNDYSLEAPSDVVTLTVVDPIGGKSFVVAGCKNGVIASWDTSRDRYSPKKPDKTFQGHQNAIVSLSAINGHLLSVCEGGKLLMWSGHDLQNEHVTPIPRVLAENFHNVTSLVACERWFASSSTEDGTINVWALPDLWILTG